MAYSGSAELELGGTRLELRELRGHTRGDTVVSLPARRAVIAGDLVTTRIPVPAIVNYADGGNWTELGEALEAIGRMDFDVLVGGHGPNLTKAEFTAFKTKVHGIRERSRALIREKKTQDNHALIKEFNWGSGPAAGNLAGMMQAGAPVIFRASRFLVVLIVLWSGPAFGQARGAGPGARRRATGGAAFAPDSRSGGLHGAVGLPHHRRLALPSGAPPAPKGDTISVPLNPAGQKAAGG